MTIDMGIKTTKLFQLFSRLIGEITRLFETVLTAVFAGSTMAICIAMLMIQMEMVEHFLYNRI